MCTKAAQRYLVEPSTSPGIATISWNRSWRRQHRARCGVISTRFCYGLEVMGWRQSIRILQKFLRKLRSPKQVTDSKVVALYFPLNWFHVVYPGGSSICFQVPSGFLPRSSKATRGREGLWPRLWGGLWRGGSGRMDVRLYMYTGSRNIYQLRRCSLEFSFKRGIQMKLSLVSSGDQTRSNFEVSSYFSIQLEQLCCSLTTYISCTLSIVFFQIK